MFDSEEHYGRVFYVPGNHELSPQKTMTVHCLQHSLKCDVCRALSACFVCVLVICSSFDFLSSDLLQLAAISCSN